MRVAALCLAVLTLVSWSFAERSGRDLTPAELKDIRGGYDGQKCMRVRPECNKSDLPWYVDDCGDANPAACMSFYEQKTHDVNGNKECVSIAAVYCQMGGIETLATCRSARQCREENGVCLPVTSYAFEYKVSSTTNGTWCP